MKQKGNYIFNVVFCFLKLVVSGKLYSIEIGSTFFHIARYEVAWVRFPRVYLDKEYVLDSIADYTTMLIKKYWKALKGKNQIGKEALEKLAREISDPIMDRLGMVMNLDIREADYKKLKWEIEKTEKSKSVQEG